MSLTIIGDVHGKFTEYSQLLRKLHAKDHALTTIQLGDLGIGFPKQTPKILVFPEKSKFFRGNHDAPIAARNHPNYLGDYGSLNIDGHNIFYVGRAWSIDQAFRKAGVSWWPEEELTAEELTDAFNAYVEAKPDIMITHDGPSQATAYILNQYSVFDGEQGVISTRTGRALSDMFSAHQPKLWVFGHWHRDWIKNIRGTKFVCLNELSHARVEDLLLPERN